MEVGEQAGQHTPFATRVAVILGFMKRHSACLLVVGLRQVLNQLSATGDTVRKPPPQRLDEVRPGEAQQQPVDW